MNGLDIALICSTLSQQLGEATECTAYDHLPLAPSLPACCVYPQPGLDFVDYHQTFGDSSDGYPSEGALTLLRLRARFYVGGDDESAQHTLYEYIAAGRRHPTSVLNSVYSTTGPWGALGLVPGTKIAATRWLGLIVSEHLEATWMAWACEFDIEIDVRR